MICQEQIYRDGSGPPLVLLHCLGVDHALWDIAAEGLDRQFELIRYDFPGHGTSSVPQQPYTVEDLARQLSALLDREKLDVVNVAGISLGGLVAQCFAARNPSRVDKLVLIDTTPRYTEEMRAAWHERADVARKQGVAAMTDHLLAVWFTPESIAANGQAIRYVRDQFAKCSGEGYALACQALAAADLTSCLRLISAPTLVVCGKQDIPSFVDAAHQLNQEIAGSEILWLEQARHASILERPHAFQEGLISFFSSH